MPFPRDTSTVAYIITLVKKSSQSFRFTWDGLQLAKCTPYQHFICNIPHNRQVPDALWSTKQIEIKYLAQGYKHAGRSGGSNSQHRWYSDHVSCAFLLDHASNSWCQELGDTKQWVYYSPFAIVEAVKSAQNFLHPPWNMCKWEYIRAYKQAVSIRTCCIPFWNMCNPETFFRLTWCAILKNVHFWNTFQISTVQTLSYRGQTTICLFNSLHLKYPYF